MRWSICLTALAALWLAACAGSPAAPTEAKPSATQEPARKGDDALARYVTSIATKIRRNIVLPPDAKGNPQAMFEVTQSVQGEVLAVKLLRSSGSASLDKAIEAAIKRSSPLPKPERPELFSDKLNLKFRPLDY